MSRALLDSNILIDLFNGIAAAEEELAGLGDPAISVISWIEIIAGARSDQEPAIRRFLAGLTRIDLTSAIAERAATIRRERRIKLPDAIIQATAEVSGLILVTRNERDFPDGTPGVRVPYRL